MGDDVLGGSGWLCAIAATVYLLLACWRVWRWPPAVAPCAESPLAPPLTALKPLCGDEPRLYEALHSFCAAEHPGLQIVLGARDPGDPAVTLARRLMAAFPDHDLTLVVDPREHGENPKVGNLINMIPWAKHDLIAISDSDTLPRAGCSGPARSTSPPG